MKTLNIAGLVSVLLLGVCAIGHTEHSGNPDRYPSLGLNYTGIAESGDFTTKDSGFSAKQNTTINSGALVLDGRFPVSNSLTLNAAIGLTGTKSQGDETPVVTGSNLKTNGTLINVGIRFYIK